MKITTLVLGLLTLCSVLLGLGCAASTNQGCTGEYLTDGVGHYCIYGVVIGGFCPAGLPNRLEVRSSPTDAVSAVVCSDATLSTVGALPSSVCNRIDSCRTGRTDGGTDGAVVDRCGGRCMANEYCAVAPGCGGPAVYQCTLNTCGDASIARYCGCDGVSFVSTAGACAPTNELERYGSVGACSMDAAVAPPDAAAPDAPRSADAHPVDAQGSLPCGTLTCNSGQICMLQCSGMDASGIELHRCVDVPARCANDVSCECMQPCGPPMPEQCVQDDDRHVHCIFCA